MLRKLPKDQSLLEKGPEESASQIKLIRLSKRARQSILAIKTE